MQVTFYLCVYVIDSSLTEKQTVLPLNPLIIVLKSLTATQSFCKRTSCYSLSPKSLLQCLMGYCSGVQPRDIYYRCVCLRASVGERKERALR